MHSIEKYEKAFMIALVIVVLVIFTVTGDVVAFFQGGPAGAIDQVKFEIGGGQIGPKGILNYRATFDIFGPKNLFIQISNGGHMPFQVKGTLYAVH